MNVNIIIIISFFNKLSAYEVAPGLSTTLQFTSPSYYFQLFQSPLEPTTANDPKPTPKGPLTKQTNMADNYNLKTIQHVFFEPDYLSFVLPLTFSMKYFFVCLPTVSRRAETGRSNSHTLSLFSLSLSLSLS